jgi:hypothetical protein
MKLYYGRERAGAGTRRGAIIHGNEGRHPANATDEAIREKSIALKKATYTGPPSNAVDSVHHRRRRVWLWRVFLAVCRAGGFSAQAFWASFMQKIPTRDSLFPSRRYLPAEPGDFFYGPVIIPDSGRVF